MEVAEERKGTWLERFIKKIEIAGNKLPHPWLFFVYFTVIVLVIAHFMDGISFEIPGKAEGGVIKTLLNPDGLRYMLTSMVKNFVSFPPIGLVLPIAIAVGIGEQAGLFESIVLKMLRRISHNWITALFMFITINSSIASDARYAIVIPVGATLYLACGRNPLIGVIAGYAGCSGGLSASVAISAIDAALAGLTQQAAQILPLTASQPINPANNWYIMIASTFLLTFVGTIVTEKIIAPMLDKDYDARTEQAAIREITEDENRGLRYAGVASLIFFIILLALTVPQGALLRDVKTGNILPNSPFMSALVPIVTLFFMVVGIAYGKGARRIKSSHDTGTFMVKGLAAMTSFLVVCFFCAQFIDYFNVTQLGTYCAVKGAEVLKSINLTGVPLILTAVVLISIINIFLGSSTAKWAMLCVVLVPMLGLLGFSPSFTQAIYRVGDSVTNTISPLSYYYPFIIGVMQKYKPDTGIGSVMAYQIPYAITFLFFWTLLLVAWYMLGIPLGPGISALNI
jgi:aminobenzoyl-glutamate transport protein